MQTEVITNQHNHIQSFEEKQIRRRAYVRVSTREQLEGFGIDVQLTKINEYLKLYNQNTDVITHIDEGISAKNMKRKSLQELIDGIKSGQVDEVIIYKLDRLARSVSDVYYLLNLMLEHNCNLISVMDHLDIHSANGRMVIGILAVIAQWERETISERTVDSIVEQLDEGLYPFSKPPFGYDKVDKKLVENQEESAALNYTIKRACEGKVLSEISKELKSEYGIDKRDDKLKAVLEKDYYATGEYEYKGRRYAIVPIIVKMNELKLARKSLKKRAVLKKNYRYHYHNKVRTMDGNICNCKPTKKKSHHVYYYEYGNKRINQNKLDEQVLFRTIIYANEKDHVTTNIKIRKQVLKLESKMEELYEQFINNKLDAKSYGFTMQKIYNELDEKRKKEYVLSEDDMNLNKWSNLTDKEKSIYLDEYISSIIVDLDLKIVVKINFK